MLLALAALLAQVWIAAPHSARQLVAALAPASRGPSIAQAEVEARARCSAQHHDPARCPICQASALARSAVTSSADARPVGILSPALVVVAFRHDPLRSAPVDPKTAPRAPPA